MNGRERERELLKKGREREKEQNEKIPDPSIHPSIPSIYLLAGLVCLFGFFFCCPSFSPTLPYLTLPYCTAVYLDCFLELGFEAR